MPKLWSETIDAHRRAVRDATLDAAAALVMQRGLASVTMSEIAEKTGIGRATLYKYFSDVEGILLAWHERQIAAHLEHLNTVREEVTGKSNRVQAVLEAYALIAHQPHGHHDAALAAFLHRDKRVAHAGRQLRALIQELLTEGAAAGELRDDVAPGELASFCLHAIGAARDLPSRAAVKRLVAVILAALRHPD